MKWWLAGSSFLICVGIGLYIYGKSRSRVQFYTGLVNFCDYLSAEIGFAHQPLPQLIAQFHDVTGGRCQTLLQNYLALLQQKSDVTRAKCQQLINDVTVAEFLFGLGRMDTEAECEKIAGAKQVFLAQQRQAEHHLRTKASITLKLLIIMGIAGVILWI